MLHGLMSIARTPIGDTPDCWSHVYRINAIYNGDIIARRTNATSGFFQIASENYGGAVDWDIINLSLKYPGVTPISVVDVDTITDFNQHSADVPFNNSAVYTPIPYLPYVAALAFCRAIPALDSPETIYYAMEITGLMTFVALLAFSIWMIPRFRIVMALFFFLLFFGISGFYLSIPTMIGCDMVTCGLASLLACLLLRCYYEYPSQKGFLLIAFCSGLLALTKFSYAPLIFVPLPVLLAHNKLQGSLPLFALAAVFLMALFAWVHFAADFASTPTAVPYAVVQERSSAFLANPFTFFRKMYVTIASLKIYHGEFSKKQAAFVIFAWGGSFAMIISSLVLGFRKKLSWRKAVSWAGVAVLLLCSLVLIYLALYLQYDQSDSPIIYGIQVRYFVPLFPFIAVGFLENFLVVTSREQTATN